MNEGERVEKYLETVSDGHTKFCRVECCGSSRSFYCPECIRLLVPLSECPLPLQDESLCLPFDLHIVLDDRRASATGLHAVALLEKANVHESHHEKRNADVCSEDPSNVISIGRRVSLIDLDRGDSIPSYNDLTGSDDGSTYLLFPSQGESVPLASVAGRISRLVVLDCKWTKSSGKRHPALSKLQKVHLTSPPQHSYFWRWHNAGQGMLSTIEAIYYAALEVAGCREEFSEAYQGDLLILLWLFALQRAAIQNSARQSGKVSPFSECGKEEQRALRKYKGTEKQARDKEMGKLLKEKARREREDRRRASESST